MPSPTPVSTCDRFRWNGDSCTNLTDRVDGWCHESDCDGFTQPHAERDPQRIDRAPLGTRKHIALTQDVPLDVDIDEVNDVRVTLKARARYVDKHGVSPQVAEMKLRQMLEDFLLQGARLILPSGYVKLSRDGYWVTLSPDHGTVTDYDTVHRERTWEQVKAGVQSRFKVGSHLGPPPGPAAGRTDSVAVDDLLSSIRPYDMHVSWRTIKSFGKLAEMRAEKPEIISSAARASLAAGLAVAVLGDSTEHYVKVATNSLSWTISRDAYTVIGVSRLPRIDRQ